MNKKVLSVWIPVFFLIIMLGLPFRALAEAGAQGQAEEEGVLNGIFKAVGGAAKESLEEGIDEFTGAYDGRIGEVRLLERRGNEIVLEVRYENVRREDGVYVKSEVLRWGEPLEGFSSTLSPVKGKEGSVNLRIGLTEEQEESEWESAGQEVESDQIRLFLVRETKPDRPFGSLIYDFPKTWTHSSEIETAGQSEGAETAQEQEAIELAEEESSGQAEPGSSGSGIIQTGSLLKPVQAGSAGKSGPGKTLQKAPSPRRVSAADKRTLQHTVSEYNFFANASRASWKSKSGRLPFPGSSNDRRGFARTIENGSICPGNKAVNLLETHPQWVNGGWIQGRFPLMRLGSSLEFRALGALLKGAEGSDGVYMSVYLLEEGKEPRRLVRKHVTCRQYLPLRADLSSWAGREVQIVLRVGTGRTSGKDWAVWVNPRLAEK